MLGECRPQPWGGGEQAVGSSDSRGGQSASEINWSMGERMRTEVVMFVPSRSTCELMCLRPSGCGSKLSLLQVIDPKSLLGSVLVEVGVSVCKQNKRYLTGAGELTVDVQVDDGLW
jgi:hypothetical protein